MATLSIAAKNAALNAIGSLAAAGSTLAGGSVVLYGPGGTPQISAPLLLGTGAAFNAASGGSMTSVNSPLVPSFGGGALIGSGTISTYNLLDRDLNFVLFGNVGLTGSGADIEFDGVNAISGQFATLGQITLTFA